MHVIIHNVEPIGNSTIPTAWDCESFGRVSPGIQPELRRDPHPQGLPHCACFRANQGKVRVARNVWQPRQH